MKNIYPLLIISIFLFSTSFLSAQSWVQYHLFVNHQSLPGMCDGSMEIHCNNCPQGTSYTWFDSTSTVIGTGSFITGLCEDYYYVVPSYNCQSHGLFTSVHDATVSGAGFDGYITIHLDTSTNCVGYVETELNGVVGPYIYDLYNYDTGMLLEYEDSLPSITGWIADSMCYFNRYTVDVMDSLYNYISLLFDPNENVCFSSGGQLWMEAQGFPISDSSMCDGIASSQAYGGTLPYNYQYSSGSITSDETNLCPGSYVVTVTDGNGDAYSSTFIIGYPGTYYFNDPGSLVYVDTLYANAAQNCGIDFNQPLDTFYVDTMYNISPYIYVGEWILVQDSIEYLFSETYHVPDSTQNFMFGLSVFCSVRSFEFGSYSLFCGMAGVTTGISEANNDIFSATLSPNPLEEIAIIEFEGITGKYTLEARDLSGRMVYGNSHQAFGGKNKIDIDLSSLADGFYVFTLTNDSGIRQNIPFIKTALK